MTHVRVTWLMYLWHDSCLCEMRAVLIRIPNIKHKQRSHSVIFIHMCGVALCVAISKIKQRSHSVIFLWILFHSEPIPRKRNIKHKQRSHSVLFIHMCGVTLFIHIEGMSHVTYTWVVSHIHESCHIYMSHVTYTLFIHMCGVALCVAISKIPQRSHFVIFFWILFHSEPFPRKRKHKQGCTSHIWKCNHLWHMWQECDQILLLKKLKIKRRNKFGHNFKFVTVWPSKMSQIGH